MTFNNLDLLAAETAQAIVRAHANKAEDLDGLATKALGVLQQDGLYAGLLFLYSRTGKEDQPLAATMRTNLLNMLTKDALKPLKQTPPQESGEWSKVSTFLTKDPTGPLANLDTLLLLKDVFEQTLIYVRYSAKAAKVEAEIGKDPAKKNGIEVVPTGAGQGGTS